MKTIKIYCLPSHQTKERTSGVDFARVIQPMKYLNGYKDADVAIETKIFQMDDKTDWLAVAKEYDVIFLNYIANSWGYAALGAMARAHKRKIVFDIDDALWFIKNDNPAYEVYKKGGQAIHDFTCIVNDVDLVTVTTPYLRNVVINQSNKTADKIKVRPNFIDLTLYDHRPAFKNTPQINLVHFGSTTHFNDLVEPEFKKGIDRIMSEYPNVVLRFVGAFIPYYRQRWGARYENQYGHQDIYQWIAGRYREVMSDSDIVLAPLTSDIYNRSKSEIKFLEYSAALKPGVYQHIKQYSDYVTNGVNGYLAARAEDWYSAISKMIMEPEHRKSIGQNAFETIQKHTIQKNVYLYADMFKKLLRV